MKQKNSGPNFQRGLPQASRVTSHTAQQFGLILSTDNMIIDHCTGILKADVSSVSPSSERFAQFTINIINYLKPNSCVQLRHRRSTAVSTPLSHTAVSSPEPPVPLSQRGFLVSTICSKGSLILPISPLEYARRCKLSIIL